MLKTFDLGLAKIMSKMGISVVDSYRGAHLFDSIGLNDDVIFRCLRGTPAPLGGIGFAEIEAQVRRSWQETFHPEPPVGGAPASADLPDYGWVRFRKADIAEPHAWQPQRVKVVQSSVGSVRGAVAVAEPQSLSVLTAASEAAPQMLRDMLNIRAAGPSLAEDSIESTPEITRRFIASAMSLGSLSPEAHGTITEAMNILGARSNTGEGGEDPAVWAPDPLTGGRGLHNNKIKQLASGRFGVTAEYLANAEEIEIKIAQGSKPGEGGQLPAHKVTELIARLRHAQPGVMLISPPPHHDIYSIEDLAQLIYDLKRVNPPRCHWGQAGLRFWCGHYRGGRRQGLSRTTSSSPATAAEPAHRRSPASSTQAIPGSWAWRRRSSRYLPKVFAAAFVCAAMVAFRPREMS